MKKGHPYAIALIEMVWTGLSEGLRIVYNFIGFQHPLAPDMLRQGGNDLVHLALYYLTLTEFSRMASRVSYL